ncbi:hypothetical protein FDZ58_02150 [Ehrlichia ruminantium]|nr:hypothetical protein FDZ68_02140 [Ehrlichia ruminantium]QLK51910.1 hypothetical protein FDZ66_02145 [Ehrlichia ruminantium]QLK53750.1 hypothetical protein FDZ64_02145 [Ehrlichia ruminantium]QLK59243.1 hypothetical protein FDZ58_02150 [Ehrlichia ruminantium]GAT75244.1 putative integral membrane protein [Ehrlichia ruminantium]
MSCLKSKHSIKYFIALCANVTYFSVFLFAIFIQLINIPSKLSARDLLLINVLMVLLARIALFSLALYELKSTYSKIQDNSLEKYKKVAYTAELISTIVAIIIQVVAINNIILGDVEIVSTNKSVIHTKGAVDFTCILIKLLISAPLLMYFNYRRMKDPNMNDHKGKLKTLFYLSIAIFITNFIAFVGKIINVLEQTQSFSLFNIQGKNNNGPDNFPLGPMIRILCIVVSIIILTITFTIESFISSTLNECAAYLIPNVTTEKKVAKEGFEPTTQRL